MRLPRNEGGTVDYKPLQEVVDAFIAEGFSDFDTGYRCLQRVLKYNAVSNTTEFQYQMTVRKGGKPSLCITCRACKNRCPQNIEISDALKVPVYEKIEEHTKPDITPKFELIIIK